MRSMCGADASCLAINYQSLGVFKSQFSNIFQETGALLGQKLTKAHQWLKERT